MDNPPSALYSHHQFEDIEDWRDDIDGLIVQLDKGALQIDIETLAFQDLYVSRLATNRRVMLETYSTGWTTFILCGQRTASAMSWCGIPAQKAGLIVVHPERQHDFIASAGWEDLEISVSDRLLRNSGIALDGGVVPLLSSGDKQLQLPESYAYALSDWLRALLRNQHAPWALANPVSALLLRDSVLDKLFEALTLGMRNTSDLRFSRPYRRYKLVRRALDRIRSLDAPLLTCEDLCVELGTNRRSLERAFNDVIGTSPYQYLLKVRLCKARADLRSSEVRPVIADVAAKHGFPSGSAFSQQYSRLYGEKPSTTITGSRLGTRA